MSKNSSFVNGFWREERKRHAWVVSFASGQLKYKSIDSYQILNASNMRINEYRITLTLLSSEEAEKEILLITLSWIFLFIFLLANICVCMRCV